MNESPTKKTREQRFAERAERQARFELYRARGESRGWQIKSSAGMPVMQFIPGGRFQPVNP